MNRILLAIFVFFTSLMITPTAAEAKPPRVPWNKTVIEVTENLPSSWDVKGAAADLDYYTGSQIKVVSKCSGKNSCVNIRVGKVKGKPVGFFEAAKCSYRYEGWSGKSSVRTCPITIDTGKASKAGTYGYSTKRWLVRHELGHWLSLGHNSKKCVSTMYEYTRCKGKVPPNAFTSAEQKKLRKQ